jgi:hypothetical protein
MATSEEAEIRDFALDEFGGKPSRIQIKAEQLRVLSNRNYRRNTVRREANASAFVW